MGVSRFAKTRREEVSLKIEQVAAIDLTAQSRADVGPIEPTGDVFELSLDEHPGYLAFDVVVLLEPTPGRMIEQRLAVFGVVGTDFKFTPLTWKMWACNSGASDCITDDNGVQYVVISSETGVQ